MAVFYSTVRFNQNLLDWNAIIEGTSATNFDNNRNDVSSRVTFSASYPVRDFSFVQGQRTVEDILFIWWDPDNVTSLGGSDIRMGPEAPKSGTLTFFQTLFDNTTKTGKTTSFHGFSVDITDFAAAAGSADTADDQALFEQMMSGKDYVFLSKGRDVIRTGAKDDIILGGGGGDRLEGENGDDLINGESGNDSLFGGKGDDVLVGGSGNDRLDGGDGIDTAVFGNGAELNIELYHGNKMDTGEGTDQLISIENAVGGNLDDKIRGSHVANHLFGMDGDDTIDGFEGNDILDGGAGRDSLYGGSEDDRLYGQSGQDYLDGGFGKDKLFGGDDDDLLEGRDGNDLLNGGKGEDELFGELGRDRLIGGRDADTFSFRKADGTDTIRDFEDGIDMIRILEGPKVFKKLTLADTGTDVLISFAETEIIVKNTELGDLTRADFLFG